MIVKYIGNRHFSHYDKENDVIYVFADGTTSWSSTSWSSQEYEGITVTGWNSFECELVED